jgi:Zn-dependent peptidase ImmA (M78 family)/transcriptional regulator with XRE-family HTH domain
LRKRFRKKTTASKPDRISAEDGVELDFGDRRNLPKPIPERIKEAREARGFTPESFAEVLDVSRQAVAQYETGQISPSGEIMARIIALTAQPPVFFITPRNRASAGISPFWRSLKRMEQYHRRRIARRLEWAYDISAYIEKFLRLPEVCLPSINFDVDGDDAENIELIAEAIRDCWNLGRGAVGDLAAIFENNGLLLIKEAVDCPDMDAVSCWQSGRPFVLYSAEVTSAPRAKWNLAHELGHLVLHSGVEITTRNLDRIEKQANRFAGAFLLPQETFSKDVLATSIGYFKELKKRWGVAIAAMAYRSKDLGIINDNQHSYLMRQMNALKIRKHEPLDDAFPLPQPSILGESIKMLIENQVQTSDQIERALGLNLADVESLCGVPTGYLNSRVVKFMPRPRVV